MKQKLLNSLRLRVCALVALLLCATGSAWADSYTITFSTGSGDGTSASTSTACSTIVSAGSSYLSGNLVTATYVYYNGGSGLKLGKGGGAGTIKMNLASSVTPTSIVVSAKRYNTSKAVTLKVNGGTGQDISNSSSFSNYTFTIGSSISYIELNASQYSWIESVTVNYATPVTGVSLNKSATTLEVGDTETLTATVAPANADNKNVAWSSDDEDVATVDSNGKITAVAAGSANITVTTQDGSKTATCAVTVTAATKTAVNMTGFSATSTTIVKGNTTTTSVTNDKVGWDAAYTYSSSDETVATVNSSGVITAVKKGSATITATLNVNPSDETYKAGTTTSKTVDITVTNPFHNVTFSSNGSTYSGSTSVEEGESISLPAVNPGEVNGYTFQGWKAGTITGTTDDEPEYISSPVMGDADITYYAVFAEEETSYSESEIDKTQTLQYDTWTYGGTTSSQSSYRLFGNAAYVESAAFDLSLLKKVIVYGGTYGGSSYNSFTIGDGTNTWKSGTVSGSNATGTNEVTGGTTLSGTKKLYVTSTCGNGSNSGLRISKVEIYTKKRTTTCSNYCTTVSALPKPVITMADVDMTWGDADKYVAPTATVGEEAYEGSFSYSVDKDGLTVASDGKLTSSTPGTYVVTASIAATEDYQAASTTCTVTVGKQDVTLAFADATVRKKTSDASYTQTATATPAAYDGTIAYSKESASTSAGATVNSSTGAVSFSATGSVIVKATAPATAKYNTAETTYTILVQTNPTLSVSNQTKTYGQTYTLDTSSFLSGEVTLSSSNAVATIDGLVITAAAEGIATITVTTAETDTYIEGKETFTFTVTALEGLEEVPDPTPITVFYEGFSNCSGDWDEGSFNGSGTSSLATDNDGWTTVSANAGNKCAKFGASKTKGSAETPAITVTKDETYTITFKAAPWDAETTRMSVSVAGGSITGISNSDMTTQKWNNYSGTITANSTSLTISFEADGNNRFFLDEVLITKAGDPIVSDEVTINKYGYATYSSIYPMDFSSTSGYTAWRVESISSDGTITFKKINDAIKGGQGVLLYNKDADGENTNNVTVAFGDGDVEFTTEQNKLVGTTAPKNVAAESAYGLSGNKFVKNNAAGNIPAGKAYIEASSIPAEVKSFTFVFEDETTGITETRPATREEVETIFNLGGQRLQKMQRGVNIVNGRKVLVK